MKKALSFGLMLFLAVAITGCAGLINLPSVCDDMPPGESWLCAASHSTGVSLGTVSLSIRVAHAAALGSGLYSPKEALAVVSSLDRALDVPITYVAFKEVLLSEAAAHPGTLEIGGIILSTFTVPEVVKPADVAILKSWLANRRAELARY